ncbi:homeodomain-like superfamily protein isoform X2 [Tasmannia lanceolata]|uniref:homeodomain-like superfamily protein isoform X2 n=1 Tax=Tasmannia lanceolata TaxID=3420 RepID=UPI0040647A1C
MHRSSFQRSFGTFSLFAYMLEKEALLKGVPLGQAHDIDIPPPRPKRKPSNPYPRKTGLGGPISPSFSSSYPSKQVLELENDPPLEKPAGTETFEGTKETSDDANCSEIVNLFQEVPSVSTSASKTSVPRPTPLTNPSTFSEFAPPGKEKNDQAATDESSFTIEPNGNQKLDKCEGLEWQNHCLTSHANFFPEDGANKLKQAEKLGLLSTNERLATQSCPRHVPVHVVEGSIAKCMQTPSSDMTIPVSTIQSGAHGSPTISSSTEHHPNSARSNHQPFPILHSPFTMPHNNQDAYTSLLNNPSYFSSLILSTLLQNPAAHAAGSLAASFWTHTNESSADILLGGFPLRHTVPTPSFPGPSLAAIAATTVAAATAWWSSHGLLPLCPPIHTPFNFTPQPTTAIPSTDTTQAPEVNKDTIDNTQNFQWEGQQLLGPEFSAALKTQHQASKSSLSSSDLDGSRDAGSPGAEPKAASEDQQVSSTVFHDPNKGQTGKQLDRSSCGSNTPSSSEVETDVVLEKHTECKEESKEAELSHLSGELISRRCRSTGNVNDSWKEVSEEGRLAFQALFSRNVLPQSFSPPHNLRSKVHPKDNIEESKQKPSKNDEKDTLELELGNKTLATFIDLPPCIINGEFLRNDSTEVMKNGLFGNVKLKARRAGFKPYKRCSMEAKESRVVHGGGKSEENVAKRIRLEGEGEG